MNLPVAPDKVSDWRSRERRGRVRHTRCCSTARHVTATCQYKYIFICIHACIYSYMYITCVWVYLYIGRQIMITWIDKYTFVRVRAYLYTCVRIGVRSSYIWRTRSHIYTYMSTYVFLCWCTYVGIYRRRDSLQAAHLLWYTYEEMIQVSRDTTPGIHHVYMATCLFGCRDMQHTYIDMTLAYTRRTC